MGKISEVLYQEINPDEYSVGDAGSMFYDYNLLGIDPMFQEGYEEDEIKSNDIRNKVIREHVDGGRIVPNSALISISSMRNRAVFIGEYE